VLIASLAALLGAEAANGHPSTVQSVLRCFQQHNVVAEYAPSGARDYGLTTGKWLNFHFTGVPQGAIDGGSVVVEPDRVSAQREAKRLYRRLYAYDLAHTANTTPAYLRLILRKTIQVSGDGIEVWGDTVVSPPARRIVGSCLE
jgi:hypothetical protein